MKKLLAAIAASLVAVSALALPTFAGDKGNTGLSEYGTQAVSELASCLRTSDSLDVYYVIDNSTSLGGDHGTDPNNERAAIIEQDIKRWADIGALQPTLKIRIAGSLFSQNATPIKDWTNVTKSNAASVAKSFISTINNQNLHNYTNWEAGLSAAYDKLSNTGAQCKAMIWFTDGGIWPGEPRDKSTFESIQALCGPATDGKIPTENSDEGLMAQIRAAQIHVFGILLHSGKDTEKNESFYRSMMLPVIEESGPVAKNAGLPSGDLKCGENATGEERDYATGAFLEAQSAADVAFGFMSIPAIVGGGSLVDCQKSGEFYVDPGIGSVEFSTDATSWTITDAEGKVQAQSSAESIKAKTTDRVPLPDVTAPETWKFNPKGGAGKCALYVYPELYLELHDKSLITGRETSITGQFVHSLTSGEKADLSVFKSARFDAAVDGKTYPSKLNQSTGAFEINNYTPAANIASAQVSARLELETQHYKLDPITFEASEKVYDAAVLPEVGKIRFTSELTGVRFPATAKVTIKAPASSEISTKVCFKTPQVIGDHQNESAGKATDRSKSWKWTTKGLDAQGCIDILRGVNRDQEVTFELNNTKQANSEGEALFEYTITALGFENLKDIPDSQTASFETKTVTSKPLFILFLVLLLLAGLAIPFGILTLFNLKNARLSIGHDVVRGEFPVYFDRELKSLNIGNSSDYFANGEVLKAFLPVSAPSLTPKTFTDPVQGVVVETKVAYESVTLKATAPWWPLALPAFTSVARNPNFTFSADASEPSGDGHQVLRDGKLASFAYLIFKEEQVRHAKQFGEPIEGTLVVFSNRSADVLGADLNNRLISLMRDSVLLNSTAAAVDSIEVQVVEKRTIDGETDVDFDGYGATGGSTSSASSGDFDISFD